MSIYSDPDGWNDWMESQPKERRKRDTIYKKGETIRRQMNSGEKPHTPGDRERQKRVRRTVLSDSIPTPTRLD